MSLTNIRSSLEAGLLGKCVLPDSLPDLRVNFKYLSVKISNSNNYKEKIWTLIKQLWPHNSNLVELPSESESFWIKRKGSVVKKWVCWKKTVLILFTMIPQLHKTPCKMVNNRFQRSKRSSLRNVFHKPR